MTPHSQNAQNIKLKATVRQKSNTIKKQKKTINFQKSTKKLKFTALLKYFFNFVPRGTNVENFFVRKIPTKKLLR